MMLAQLTALATALALPHPPVMPRSFQVQVLDQSSDGTQSYMWFYDYANQREAKVFSTPNGLETSIYIYHNVSGCENDNECLTAYNFGPHLKCTGVKLSNTMDVFFGWLSDDQFTHQKATFLQHDLVRDCDVWEHNSKPIYPITANQTACIHTDKDGPSPIYMHFYGTYNQGDVRNGTLKEGIQGGAFKLEENVTYTNFKLVKSFAPGTFTPPSPCPVSTTTNQV
jgi:hypothetical protein